MSTDIVRTALVFAGAVALVIGPALQAKAEISEYRELLSAVHDSDLPDVGRDYLEVSLRIFFPTFPRPLWLKLLAIFTLPLWFWLWGLRFVWPPWLIQRFREIRDLLQRYALAVAAFAEEAGRGDERAILIHGQLRKARNWSVIVVGALLARIVHEACAG